MTNEILNSILDYVTLRIKGAGRGLSDEEVQSLRGLREGTWDAIEMAIVGLGGLLPEGSTALHNVNEEIMSLSRNWYRRLRLKSRTWRQPTLSSPKATDFLGRSSLPQRFDM